MTSGFVLSLCKTISVFCNCFVLLLYFFSQAGYTLNAPASRRIIGYQFTNPHSGKGFTNVFAYEQHRNDAVRAGTLCASLTMRVELTGVRRVDRPIPDLHARPSTGLNGANSAKCNHCGCCSASTQSDEHVAGPHLPSERMPTDF